MITEEMVQTRHKELSKPNHMGTMGHDQANSAMHVLSHLLNYAADNLHTLDGQPIITANPVRKLNQNKRWYKTNRRELVVPNHKLSEWYQAIMALESTMIRDYLLLLILTGLRRTEAISLKWSDINFDDQTLTISAEISKNHREHKLPLSDFILALLAQRRGQVGQSQWVFPRSDADQFMAYPYDAIQLVAGRAGCPFTPHALRRTFCSVAARSGVGHHLIRKLVNHTRAVINIKSTSINATTYTAATSGGATETINLAPASSVSQYAYNNVNALTGISAGGVTYFQGLSNKALQSATINGTAATLNWAESFSGNATLSSGNNAVPVSGTDGGGNVKTNTYQVSLTGPSSSSLTYDQNGCMTSDGIKSYSWDAEKRLIKITYPGSGNNSQFTYDAMSGLVKIVETASGSVTSTKQFVRCGSQICEERNASSAITKQFFAWGQTLSGTNYFYTKDGPPGSVRDMTDPDGNLVAHYEYGMYGEVTQTVGTLSADFGYAGYYVHAPSGLNLTTYRAYSPTLGRWINRDPIGEDGGVNLYSYVLNKPVLFSDPRGLSGSLTICALPAGTSSFCGCEPGHVWLSWKEDNSFIGPHIYGSPLESTTYGTYEGQGLQPGKDGGLISGSPNQGGYCKTIKVDDAGEFRLKAYIAAMSSKGESAWKFPRGTCVQFANNGWNVAGGPGLGLNGWSGPQDAADAIQAHGGLAF